MSSLQLFQSQRINFWNRYSKNGMNQARSEMACIPYYDSSSALRILVAGGSGSVTVESYSVVTDSWSYLASLPSGINLNLALALSDYFTGIESQIYVKSASDSLLFKYDHALDSWTQVVSSIRMFI